MYTFIRAHSTQATPLLPPLSVLIPDWPAPDRVRTFVTTRQGGVSLPPFDSFNLGDHVGDDPQSVATNRASLRQFVPTEPCWLNQVHGIEVIDADLDSRVVHAAADASFSRESGTVCVVMSADCLPVFFCDRGASVVAVAHAGWRGLCQGVLEATLTKMGISAKEVLAWLGPAIGPGAYEVGPEVHEAFLSKDATFEQAFSPTNAAKKWKVNLYTIARRRLELAGVDAVYGGNFCTYTEKDRFFSYRRDGKTGRMANLIWLD